MSKTRGFTFPEFVAVVAVIVALAGVITPYVARDLDGTKHDEARNEVNRIASAILQYMNDTQYPPTGKDGRPSFHCLVGEGHSPTENVFRSGEQGSLDSIFTKNDWQTASWQGPYLDPVGADPWGSHYLVNVEGFWNHGERVFVLSAGPNRRIDTKPTDLEAGGDDIAIVIR